MSSGPDPLDFISQPPLSGSVTEKLWVHSNATAWRDRVRPWFAVKAVLRFVAGTIITVAAFLAVGWWGLLAGVTLLVLHALMRLVGWWRQDS